MIRVSRAGLKLASIVTGILFTAAVFQTMHNNSRWDWSAPGVGKLPREVIADFMQQAYLEGHGGAAAKDYFAVNAKDNVPEAIDRQDGDPIPHQVRSITGQGMTVIVIHRIRPTRGEPHSDVIDRFEVKDGRIAVRERFVTRFDN